MSQPFTIYHNTRCSKSRQTLQLLRDHGIEPTIVEYLKTPLSAATLRKTVKMLAIEASELIRKKEKVFKEVCPDGDVSNADAIQLMVEHPELIERPIVVAATGAAIGRPPENILELLAD